LRLHSKKNNIWLILNRRKNGNTYLRYAFGSGLNSKDRKKWPERIASNRVGVWNRIESILESEQTSIEGYSVLPELSRSDLAPLRNFNYQDLCMNIAREIDEKKKSQPQETNETKDKGPKRPDRKFLGKAKTLEMGLGYFDLVKFAYQKYDHFGLMFSAERKPSLNLVFENSDKKKRNGPYNVICVFFDENFTEKDKISQEDLEKGVDIYTLERLKARFSQGHVKIEGYSNPPISERSIKFLSPMDDFIKYLARALPAPLSPEAKQKMPVNLGAEDLDTKVSLARKIQNRRIMPSDGKNPDYIQEIDQRWDHISGEDK